LRNLATDMAALLRKGDTTDLTSNRNIDGENEMFNFCSNKLRLHMTIYSPVEMLLNLDKIAIQMKSTAY